MRHAWTYSWCENRLMTGSFYKSWTNCENIWLYISSESDSLQPHPHSSHTIQTLGRFHVWIPPNMSKNCVKIIKGSLFIFLRGMLDRSKTQMSWEMSLYLFIIIFQFVCLSFSVHFFFIQINYDFFFFKFWSMSIQ